MALGIIGIIVALAIFLYGAYKNVSVLYLAPLCGIIVAVTNVLTATTFDFATGALVSNPVTITEAFTSLHVGSVDFANQGGNITYSVGGVVGMIMAVFPTIFLGALFGQILTACGAAGSIATTLVNKLVLKTEDPMKRVSRVVLSMLLVEVVLTFGGVDGFVTVFATFPIAMIMAEKSGIPRRMVPALLVLSCGANSAPFVLSINNILCMAVLGTAPGAAAIPGFICFVIMEIGIYFICVGSIKKTMKKGETFDAGNIRIPGESLDDRRPNIIISVLPLVVVFLLFAIVKNASLALVWGIVAAAILMSQYIPKKQDASSNAVGAWVGKMVGVLNDGAGQGASALMTLTAAAGFAAVVQHTEAFGAIVGMLFSMNVSPLLLTLILVAVIVAFTSSPPAALGVALPMIAGAFIWVQTPMVNPDAVARVAAITASTFETLPVNGLVLLTTGLAQVKIKDAYMPIFLQSVIMTLIGAIICLILCTLFPGMV